MDVLAALLTVSHQRGHQERLDSVLPAILLLRLPGVTRFIVLGG
jgi:hypothetical protein